MILALLDPELDNYGLLVLLKLSTLPCFSTAVREGKEPNANDHEAVSPVTMIYGTFEVGAWYFLSGSISCAFCRRTLPTFINHRIGAMCRLDRLQTHYFS